MNIKIIPSISGTVGSSSSPIQGNVNNNIVSSNIYTGADTDTASTQVNQDRRYISVDVRKTPGSLSVVDGNQSVLYDGSTSQSITLAQYRIQSFPPSSASDLAEYALMRDGEERGVRIHIPKDQALQSVSLRYCAEDQHPLPMLRIGDPYLEFQFLTDSKVLYVSLADLIDDTAAGYALLKRREITVEGKAQLVLSVDYEQLSSDLAQEFYRKAEVDTKLADKQDQLVSGINIKTLNNQPLLGSGDIHIAGGIDYVQEYESLETFPIEGTPSVIYIAKDTNNQYRWDGVQYISLNQKAQERTTWSELRSLRDSGQLVPGVRYRITDYRCTSVQNGTSADSHLFDIIVLALTPNTLSEEAWATWHDGDEYFSESDLNAWRLWYCLDNNYSRYHWADTTNGRGVVYRMVDEFNNDVAYDFKNIKFGGYYTFDISGADASLKGFTAKCYNNVIPMWSDYATGDKILLSNNRFSGSGSSLDCHDNVLGYNCHDNYFGSGSYYNRLGNFCYQMTFGSSCSYNEFGHDNRQSSFSSGLRYNRFGNGCYGLSFSSSCTGNIVNNSCTYLSLSSSCTGNTFGNQCANITLGASSNCNTFEAGCTQITSSGYLQGTHIGAKGTGINFPQNYCRNISIEAGCQYLTISSENMPDSSNWIQNVRVQEGMQGTSSERKNLLVPLQRTGLTEFRGAGSEVILVA